MTKAELEKRVSDAKYCLRMIELQARREVKNPVGRMRYSSYEDHPMYKKAKADLYAAEAALAAFGE